VSPARTRTVVADRLAEVLSRDAEDCSLRALPGELGEELDCAALPRIVRVCPAWIIRGLLNPLAFTIEATETSYRNEMWDSVSPGRTVT